MLIWLARDGIPCAGVMMIPSSWKYYAAIHGQWFISQELWKWSLAYSVSDVDVLASSTIHYSSQTELSLNEVQTQLLSQNVWVHQATQRVHFEEVLTWEIEWCFFIKKNAGPRDVCAPSVLIQEAWGTMTNLDGEAFNFSIDAECGFVASNWRIHDEYITLIWKVLDS